MMKKFAEEVYALTKKIPEGKVSTYGEIARALNSSPRAVGQALKRNPFAPVVPCHRVVRSDGAIGGFKGQKSGREVQNKISLLKKEGIKIENNSIVDFKPFTF